MIIRRFLLVLTSGAATALIFPPFNLWLLALAAWIPFFLALRGSCTRAAFYLGFLHGLLTFGITLSWLWEIFSTTAIALWGIFALFTAAFAFLVAKSKTKSPLLFATGWTGIEYFRGEIFTLHFPWITPGTGLPPNWFTPLVGVYGITFLIIYSSGLLLSKGKRARVTGSTLILTLGVATLTLPPDSPRSKAITVGLVQNETGVPDVYRQDSEELLPLVDVLVWPEYALGPIRYSEKYIPTLFTHRAKLLVSGGKQSHPNQDGRWLNSAFTYSPSGRIGHHVKNHTVHLFNDGEPGTTAESVQTPIGAIGTPVCFDCDHQDVVRRMTSHGATLFLVPSMDAEHWTTKQHEQHGILFRHRAAENGRWMAVASTSGVTQVLDSHGHVRDRLPVMEEGTLISEVHLKNHRTLFQIVGWLIGPVCLIGTLVWIAQIIFPKLRIFKR